MSDIVIFELQFEVRKKALTLELAIINTRFDTFCVPGVCIWFLLCIYLRYIH